MKRSIAAVRGALLASLVSLACQRPAAGDLRDGCPGCTWQRLGLHPQAAAQPTATGRALLTLCPWRGRLYIGYGDYQENTGPIAVTAWDPARNAFVTVHTLGHRGDLQLSPDRRRALCPRDRSQGARRLRRR